MAHDDQWLQDFVRQREEGNFRDDHIRNDNTPDETADIIVPSVAPLKRLLSLERDVLERTQRHIRYLPEPPENMASLIELEEKWMETGALVEVGELYPVEELPAAEARVKSVRNLPPNPEFFEGSDPSEEVLDGSTINKYQKRAASPKAQKSSARSRQWLRCLGIYCGAVCNGADKQPQGQENQQEIDWSQKIHVRLGNGGANIFSAKGHLLAQTETGTFRDALLEYANQFWRKQAHLQVPSNNMTVELINFAHTEHDGSSSSQMHKVPIFIPMDCSAAAAPLTPTDLANAQGGNSLLSALQCCGGGRISCFAPLWGRRQDTMSTIKKHRRARKGPSCNRRQEDMATMEDFRGVLTLAGDIRLVIGKKPCENVKDDQDTSQSTQLIPISLDVYGQDGFEKLQRFIGDVLNFSRKKNHSEKKQLYWYTLLDWGEPESSVRPVPRPIFKKVPIHGNAQYHRTYHYSFFHPKKNQLIGCSYSLLDQFRGGTGNFAIPGAQRKLNFLLHGPPGTGKSKFVRTAAMYLERNVVSFTMSQVQTEIQLLALLEDLPMITDSRYQDGEHTYNDLLFSIEEIDTDPRKICCRRDPELPPKPAASSSAQASSDAAESAASSSAQPDRQQKGKKGKQQENTQAPSTAAPLSLGLLLRTLDGGSETPGRVIVMTTNREDLLDEALKRPGRMKKIHMDNLQYPEFKQMILHFRRREGGIPTVHIWTDVVDQLAQKIMSDFSVLQAKREGTLDRKSLGLSPALLEEHCMESKSVKELFGLLVTELRHQWGKAELVGAPKAAVAVESFHWRMHSLRQAVFFHITNSQLYKDASRDWPETTLESMAGRELQSNHHTPLDVARDLLADEETFNNAIEICPTDHGHRCKDFTHRFQVELVFLRSPPPDGADVGTILKLLLEELLRVWGLAWNLGDVELQRLLGDKEEPHACQSMVARTLLGRR